MLSHDQLLSVLRYNKNTGQFIWLIDKRCGPKIGDVAGSLDNNGYGKIYVFGKPYKSSRLAWFYVTGNWPSKNIDHRNRVRSDDRFDNLRECTYGENSQNKVYTNNKLGVVGVHQRRERFCAQIQIDYKKIHLGWFDTQDQASKAYQAAKAKLHTFNPVIGD